MHKNYRLLCAVAGAAILSSTSAVSAKVKVKKFLVNGQMNSWVEQKETTKTFSGQGLFEIINGGAVEYLDKGLLEGIHQQFIGDGGKTVEVFVEDFGTTDKSAMMVKSKKESFSEAGPLAGMPDSTSFLSKAIGGLIVVVSIDRFYVEMTVSGFSDDKDAENAAIAFVNYYRKKSGK